MPIDMKISFFGASIRGSQSADDFFVTVIAKIYLYSIFKKHNRIIIYNDISILLTCKSILEFFKYLHFFNKYLQKICDF